MSGRNGNIWAMRAAGFTKLSNQRKPMMKWSVMLILALIWAAAGYLGWMEEKSTASDAIYKTIGALTVQDAYGTSPNQFHAMGRFAGVALPFVGLIFAFSGQLGEAIARLFLLGAKGHVVIAGATPAALALARSARLTKGARDAVIVIGRGLAPETAWSLRQAGIVFIDGDPTHHDTLRSARAQWAHHVVALSDDDTENLRVEAALRVVVGEKQRKHPLAAHISIRAPQLLQEAREMRAFAHGEREKAAKASSANSRAQPPIDPRPFALEEIAARDLIVRYATSMLQLAETQKHPRPHLVIFGFDATAEAVAVRAFMSLWSMHFSAPRVTIVTPNPAAAEMRFSARYPQARAHAVWSADIAFHAFDWAHRSLDHTVLADVEGARGPVNGVVVSTGGDAENIQLALALMRTANLQKMWPVPIFMKETMESDFSRQVASGDRTPNELDAYLQAFGADESTASRSVIVDGDLDRGAAIAHKIYLEDMANKANVDTQQLEAMTRTWDNVPETYRAANRATADNALIKLWDMGWKPAAGAKGTLEPPIEPALMARLAEVEHARWVAERLMSGWRPGLERNNRLMVHPNIVGWDQLADDIKKRDETQVRAAALIARATNKKGFIRR
jgi:hypothetical protein